MSSHWEWVEEITAKHDAEKPFAPENGQALRFKVGDRIIYRNDYGVEFRLRVTGFYTRPEKPCGMYSTGARYLLDWACHWFPVREDSMRLADEKPLTPGAGCLFRHAPRPDPLQWK